MHLVYDFIYERYENDFAQINIKRVCLELIGLFPFFEVKPSTIDGIVRYFGIILNQFFHLIIIFVSMLKDMLYNPAKSSGFLYNVIKYRKSTVAESSMDTLAVSFQHLEVSEPAYTDEEKEHVSSTKNWNRW